LRECRDGRPALPLLPDSDSHGRQRIAIAYLNESPRDG